MRPLKLNSVVILFPFMLSDVMNFKIRVNLNISSHQLILLLTGIMLLEPHRTVLLELFQGSMLQNHHF